MKYTLQQNSLFGNEPTIIDLPDDWDVEWHGINADNMPALTPDQITDKLRNPYGSAPLSELAKGKERVCILFDDNTRATPTQPMAEAVLKELLDAGVEKDNIIFICAVGTHGGQMYDDFVHKLGKDIVAEYAVYNHNCYENLVNIGTTKNGFDVLINKEFMSCDLRIGLGAIVPHLHNAFGGGYKLLFPGVAGIDTIYENHKTGHRYMAENKRGIVGTMGNLSFDGMRKEIEEMGRMAGQFFKVDCIYNTRLEIVDLFAGDPVEEYYAGCKVAERAYITPYPQKKDVVIANCNAKASEAGIGAALGMMGVDIENGGDLVIVNFCHTGQTVHYLSGIFGKDTYGRLAGKKKVDPRPAGEGRNIYFNPTRNNQDKRWFGDPSRFVPATSWDEVMSMLAERHGPGTRCSILADALIQYFPDPDKQYDFEF